MNTDLLITAIQAAGGELVRADDFVAGLSKSVHPDVVDYFLNCVTRAGYGASGLSVLGLQELHEENEQGASPGGDIRAYGYVSVAVSVGGNAVVLSLTNGCVYWADHASFVTPDGIIFTDRASGDVCYVPWSQENVRTALVKLSDSIEAFFLSLIKGEWRGRLDDLDR